MDGYQNEYLHVGNAYDLWDSVRQGDQWHLRYYMYTGYWPFGLYVFSWPIMALTGMGKTQLIAANLIHLMVMITGCYLLKRKFKSINLFPILFLCPAVFGSFVRFEPNFANVAWFSLGIGMLANSESLTKRKWVLGWGAAFGIGLMLDRLTLLFFLLPAVVPYLLPLTKQKLKNLTFGMGVFFLITFAYYREFFIRHSDELFSQVSVGEIDSAGNLTEADNPISGLFYLLSVPDSQAGPFIGLGMLFGLGALLIRFHKSTANEKMLVFSCLPALLFFTCIAKKQVFYTIPILVPLAVFAATWRTLSPFMLIGGAFGFLSVGCGVGSVGKPWLPPTWTAPRHTLAKPPSFDSYPTIEAFDAVTPTGKQILVLSQDYNLYEGFLVLLVRQAFPNRKVRGAILDPQGAVEQLDEVDHFIWVAPKNQTWPSITEIRKELEADHYEIGDMPSIAEHLHQRKSDFTLVGSWPIFERGSTTETHTSLYVYKRTGK